MVLLVTKSAIPAHTTNLKFTCDEFIAVSRVEIHSSTSPATPLIPSADL